jgi:predicted GNAT family acetyltransferase
VGAVSGIEGEARLVYRHERPDLIVAVHTETSGALRGKGLAVKLVERLVEDARSQGVKVRALCSYVEHEQQKHPEWADVFV